MITVPGTTTINMVFTITVEMNSNIVNIVFVNIVFVFVFVFILDLVAGVFFQRLPAWVPMVTLYCCRETPMVQPSS